MFLCGTYVCVNYSLSVPNNANKAFKLNAAVLACVF